MIDLRWLLKNELSRQEYLSGLPGPPPGDVLRQGSNLHLLGLLHWQVDSSPLAPPCSVAQARVSLWDPMDCSMPGFPVLHCLLELAPIQVY